MEANRDSKEARKSNIARAQRQTGKKKHLRSLKDYSQDDRAEMQDEL